jgi:putative transposase
MLLGMPRPLRPIDDGLIYHVINRGNNRQDVFHKPADFQAFVAALADLKDRKPFELFGYCLLNNHFHLLLRPKGATISRIMQSLLVSHTQRYHRHYRSGGHVWQGRFKSPVIQNDEHLLAVLRYIEANPLRAALVQRAEEYPWSSYRVHGLGESDELIDRLITYEDLSPLAKVRARKWAQKVHRPMDEAVLDAIRRSNATGLPYGDAAWTKRLAKRLDLDLTIRPRGRPRKSVNEPNK